MIDFGKTQLKKPGANPKTIPAGIVVKYVALRDESPNGPGNPQKHKYRYG